MNTTSITSTTNGGTGVLSTRQAQYGDNQFLQLLTAQLQNQTPLEPVDNEAFMNQLASYSSMQEQRDLNANMLKLLDYQGVLARVQGLGQGSALLGKEVTFEGPNGRETSAKVESVYVAETGEVRLKLAGGHDIEMRKVIGIAEPGQAGSGSGSTGNGNSGSTTSGSGTASQGTPAAS